VSAQVIEPPRCARPGCTNPVQRLKGHRFGWKSYCSFEHMRAAQQIHIGGRR
jgi:hypothetical protein